ncbi:glycoside hydrolase family 76 protein [Metabacillus idriensis]|uniref:glycoside hydrolase family 76 protein n=1 Tax=Metabacillus idriensis TaxID=324768 RepID=UPI0028143883|nr:glycoside hydrolase family 76 protein [Metabacillus idriensis]MDR0140117.1 glycoside hydrolase family 76 protein [Metabacillus idriensis]
MMKSIITMLITMSVFLSIFTPIRAQAVRNQNLNTERAVQSYEALQHYFYEEDSKLYLEEYPYLSGNPYSYVWPFSQAMAGTIDLSGVPKIGSDYEDDVQDRLKALELYWNEEKQPKGYDSYVLAPYGYGGDFFYDDNEWIGLEFIQLYKMTHQKKYLEKAKEIFDLVVYGWDDDPSHPAAGGVFWTQANWSSDRNTISNAPGAELGFHLYELTGKGYYFHWAKKMYDWTNENMLAPNGLFWDHIDLAGTIEKTQWSYNQGVMIGANVLLYRITHKKEYLKRAEKIADASIAYYQEGERLYKQPARFNAIFFKNLLLLEAETKNKEYFSHMQAYADRVWKEYRDPETGLFRFEGEQPITLLEQSAMVQIYASLAWKKKDYRKKA